MNATNTYESFAPLAGRRILAQMGEESIELLLQSVERHAPAAKSGGASRPADSFSLMFVAPASCRAGQGTYTLEFPEIGAIGVFLVPLGPGEGGMLYEAVFS